MSRYLLFGNLGLAKNLLYHQILCYIQRQLLSQNIMGRKILNSSEQFLCWLHNFSTLYACHYHAIYYIINTGGLLFITCTLTTFYYQKCSNFHICKTYFCISFTHRYFEFLRCKPLIWILSENSRLFDYIQCSFIGSNTR